MKNILIVDDCIDMGLLYKEALESENYRVSVVGESFEAIKVLKNKPLPNLILLDLSLPGISGVQLLKLIRQNPLWAKIKVVFVSGANNLSIRAEKAGADGFFKKPFGLAKLYSEVSKYTH